MLFGGQHMDDPQDSARQRSHEQAETIENILNTVDPALEEHAYPVNTEQLAAQYGETVIELPNETESLGSVFDRLEDDEYETPMDVKEAVLRAVSDATPDPTIAGGNREPIPERDRPINESRTNIAGDDETATPRDTESLENDTPAQMDSTPESPPGTAAEGKEPGDEFTPSTTESDEFAPQETVEQYDREEHQQADASRDIAEEPGELSVTPQRDEDSASERPDETAETDSGAEDTDSDTGNE